MSFDASRVAYRDAASADAEALVAFGAKSFSDTFAPLYPPEDLNSFLADSYGVATVHAELGDPLRETRLAFQGATLIGYCAIGVFKLPFDTGGRAALELLRLYVADEAKGAGVAAVLTDWAIERARARGAQDLYLSAYHANPRAIAFYARRGFIIVGRYDFPVGKTLDDERIMRLALD